MRLKEYQQQIKEYLSYADNVANSKEAPSPPEELALLWRLEKYGVLPEAGGLLDQPHILMSCFDVIYEERSKLEQLSRLNAQRQREWEEDQKRRGN